MKTPTGFSVSLLLSAALALGAVSAQAETWSALLEAAWQRTPDMQALQAQQTVLAIDQEEAQRWWPQAPVLSVSHRSDQWLSDEGSEWELELEAPLWRNGQRRAQQQVVAASEEERLAQQTLLRLILAGALRKAVWTLAEREAQLRVDDSRVQTAAALERDVIRRVAAGELAQADALLAQSEALAARNDKEASALDTLQAQQALELLTGQRQLPTPLSESLFSVTPDNSVSASALERHPQVLAALQTLSVARAEAGLVRNSQTPVSAALSWAQSHESLDNAHKNLLGLKVTVPLGAESRQRSAIASAQRAVIVANAQAEKVRRAVKLQVELAHATLINAQRQHDQAEKQYQTAEHSLRLSRRAFDAGELDLLSLLRLQQNTQQALAQRDLKRISSERAIAAFNQAWGIVP